jgi:integrase
MTDAIKLTAATVRLCVLSDGETDRIFPDHEVTGLGLRVRKGGSRKWVLHYRWDGAQRRHTIGPASVLSLDEARRKARKMLVAIDEGFDPAAEKMVRRAAAGLTFAAVMDDYLEARRADIRPRSLVEYTRHLRQHWKALHGLPVGHIDRPIVAAQLRLLQARVGAVGANRARSTLSSMFAWAIGEGLCDANPVIGTNKNQETQRERVLSDAELVAIWRAAPDNDFGRILRLLMLTGQRRDEIGWLRWSEIEGQGKTASIALPASRTKNHRPHDIPLSAAALAILDACTMTKGRDLVFGQGRGGYSGWSHSKTDFDLVVRINQPWTLHDLRRSAATRMADLGVQPHVIEAVLNHVSGHKAGVAGIYNRSTYAPEKRAALELWASHLITAVHAAAAGTGA